jgi:ADP-ribose pyrophosphatase YjhB (NUDIX family)
VAGTRIVDRLHRAAITGLNAQPRAVRVALVRAATPSFTIGAMCLIEDAAGRILLVRHPYRDGWGMPGGFLKRGETPEACARREVMEEVGLEVELLGPPQVVFDERTRTVETVFRARAVRSGDLEHVHPTSPELVDTGWFPWSALPLLQKETGRALAAI